MPSTNERAILSTPSLQFPPGWLQWSSRYGGGETVNFATECDLDVLAFENDDDCGGFIYANSDLRDKHQLLLSAAKSWEVTVEVSADGGERLTKPFRIRRGHTEVFAQSSPKGTLYKPEVDQ
jgi:hypothetical protein